MRVLITGVSGLLGPALARLAATAGHEVLGVASHWAGPVPGVARLLRADLTAPGAAATLCRAEKPTLVFNCAAVADPADCERDPVRSAALNLALPAELAAWSAAAGTRLLHLSSEQVFDGQHAPYTITAPPAPLHLYGRQKAAAEHAVLAADPAAAVVRAPLLLGNSLGGRRSPHEKMFQLWADGQVARLYTDELRQVCSASHLAAALLTLAVRRDRCGVFHWGGAAAVSRWAMGRAIAAHFGVSETCLQPVARADTPELSARRPRDLSLDLAPLDRELGLTPPSLADAVQELVVPAPFAAWYQNR